MESVSSCYEKVESVSSCSKPLRIELTKRYRYNESHHPTNEEVNKFQNDGYSIFPLVFTKDTVDALNGRLEMVLRGTYDTGTRPDKTPKLIKSKLPTATRRGKNEDKSTEEDEARSKKFALGYSGNKRKKVFQVINIHKSDQLFRELVTCSILGKLVAKLMKWEDGARLIQDQVWAKPPGAPPLAYHRDSPYFMFDPSPVATVWIALDNMEDKLGPLTYVKESHKWGDGRVGSSQNFFQDDGGMALLFSAANREGIDKHMLKFESMSNLSAGGLSIHDGRTWHGSSANMSNMPRRGIGLHFVPVNVKWREDAMKSTLWRKYVEDVIERGDDVNEIDMDGEIFPVTWTPTCTS